MPRCPQCRKNFPEGTFCPECGTRLVKDEPETSASFAAPKVDPCPMCGSLINEPGWTVCHACGTPRPEGLGSVEQAPEPSPECSEAEKTLSIALQSALVDGVIAPQEKAFLLDMGKRLGLSESYLDTFMERLTPFMEPDEPVKPELTEPAEKAVTDSAGIPNAQSKSPKDQSETREERSVLPNQPKDMSGLTLALRDRNRTPQSILSAAKTLLSKGISPKQLSRHIILTLGADIKDNSDCYIFPFFDAKKLKNAFFVLPAVCNEDKALLYFDNTVFGKGDEGFLLTDDTFYSSTKKLNVLSYASMTSIHADKKELFVNGISIDASSSKNNIAVLELMLNVLSGLWIGHQEQKNAGCTGEEERKLKEYKVLLKNAIDSRDMPTCNYYLQQTLELSNDRESLCREIILHIGKKIKNDSSVYLAPSFNMSKLYMAPFVSRALHAEEELLLYFDDTIFGGGDEGFVLTNKALCSSQKGLLHVPYFFMNCDKTKASDHTIVINGRTLFTVEEKHYFWFELLFEMIVRIWKDAPLGMIQ